MSRRLVHSLAERGYLAWAAWVLLLPLFLGVTQPAAVLAVGGIGLAIVALPRSRGVLHRVESGLAALAGVALLVYAAPLLVPSGDAASAAASRLAAAVERRLAADAALLEDVARDVDPQLSPGDAAGAFDILADEFHGRRLRDRGVKLYDAATGELAAWYGETLEPGPGSSSVPLRFRGRPAELVFGPNVVGVRLARRVGDWRLQLGDHWLRRSPVEALGLAPSGWLAEFERRHGVRVVFSGQGATAAGASGRPVRVGDSLVARVEAATAASAGSTGAVWLRLAALCLLGALAIRARELWCAVERRWQQVQAHDFARAWLVPLLLKGLVLAALRWVVHATGFLRVLLPGPLSSPLSFASRALGPFTSSPADLLLTGFLFSLLAHVALRGAQRWATAPSAEPRRSGARTPASARLAWSVAAAVALFALGALVQERLREWGAVLVRDTGTALLFRPDLYSSIEGAFLFAGFASLAASFILAAAALFTLAARAEDRARPPALARLWPWSLALAAVLAAAAAAHLDRSAPDVSASFLATAIWMSLVLTGFTLAGLEVAFAGRGRSFLRSVVAPAILLGLFAGSAVVTSYGAGRVWGLRQFTAARLEEVGLPSNQWLEYNLRLTGERLAGERRLLERTFGAGEAGAAFLGWTRTPLRDLPFPSALVVADAEGSVRSRFSLLPPGDLEALPDITRLALARPGATGHVQTPEGRTLFFTSVPLAPAADGERYAVAIVSEALEPSIGEASAGYFLRDVFFAEQTNPYLFAVRRGDPQPAGPRALTLASGLGRDRLWISVDLSPYLPDLLDYLSLCLTAMAGALVVLLLYEAAFGHAPIPWPRAWYNPLATFRGRVLTVLLAFVVLPIVVYSWISFQTTRHEIEQATRALAEESLKTAAAFLGPRIQAGGGAELESILPEAARLIAQDLIVYRGGEAVASNRPEIFQANLFSPRLPGDLYRRLAFGQERLVTGRVEVGNKEVVVAYLETPWVSDTGPYTVASPLLLRDVHIRRDLRELLQVLFVMFALSLLALGIFSWLVSRQLSSPLGALKQGADRIARGELAYRLRDPERSDEFGRLFSAFNTMAAGLQVSQGELLAEKGKIQAILSGIGAGVIALDRDGRVQLANQAARDLLRLPPDVVGRRANELGASPFWERVVRALRVAHRREDEVQIEDPDGLRTLHLTLAPLLGEGSERRGLVVVFEDISDVVASQRAQAWEQMARQVAHEIKNPLTPIKLSLQHLQRLQRQPPADFSSVLARNLELVLSEIGRLERIAGEFSRFGADRQAPVTVRPEPVIREVLDLYTEADDGLRFELAVSGEPTGVLADEDGLKKVLLNLLENAREAMNGGPRRGEVVGVDLVYDAEPAHALLRVRDRGPGIPAEDMGKLFQPYFSTKTRGTGLGLAIARRIVESWGGRIEAGNWEEGAEVLLWLEKSPIVALTAPADPATVA